MKKLLCFIFLNVVMGKNYLNMSYEMKKKKVILFGSIN